MRIILAPLFTLSLEFGPRLLRNLKELHKKGGGLSQMIMLKRVRQYPPLLCFSLRFSPHAGSKPSDYENWGLSLILHQELGGKLKKAPF